MGLSPPHGMGGLSTVLCRGPQNILVIRDSCRMLILSQLSHCTVKSGSYSQSLLLLSSPLSLYPSFSTPPPPPPKITRSVLLLSRAFNSIPLCSENLLIPVSYSATGIHTPCLPFFFFPRPALAISLALIFSSPRKQNNNQPVIITPPEEEEEEKEEALNAKCSCNVLMQRQRKS